jgi:hypothetical protein
MRRVLSVLAVAAASTVRADDPKPPPVRTIDGAVVESRNVLQPDADLAPPGRIDAAARIDAFRGKWVLLGFWGAWCPACHGWVIPRTVKRQERRQEYADRCVILAFHDATQKRLDEADALLDTNSKGAWNTKSLPFPVLPDAPEIGTCETWGVRGYPKLLLADPEGIVVPGGDGEVLFEKPTGEVPAK